MRRFIVLLRNSLLGALSGGIIVVVCFAFADYLFVVEPELRRGQFREADPWPFAASTLIGVIAGSILGFRFGSKSISMRHTQAVVGCGCGVVLGVALLLIGSNRFLGAESFRDRLAHQFLTLLVLGISGAAIRLGFANLRFDKS